MVIGHNSQGKALKHIALKIRAIRIDLFELIY